MFIVFFLCKNKSNNFYEQKKLLTRSCYKSLSHSRIHMRTYTAHNTNNAIEFGKVVGNDTPVCVCVRQTNVSRISSVRLLVRFRWERSMASHLNF